MVIEFKLPELGENIESGDIVNILVNEGDEIAANDGAFELETDKAVVEIPCEHAGKIVKIHVRKGESVKVGQTLLTLEPVEEEEAAAEEPVAPETTAADTTAAGPKTSGANAATTPAAATSAPAATATLPEPTGPLPAGPAARRVARELGVDLRRVAGSGSRGRITVDDVRTQASTPAGATTPGVAGAMPVAPVTPPGEPGQDNWGPITQERMPKIRRTIAAQMVKSVTTIPHVTNFDDADVSELEALRKSIPPGYLGEDIKLTAMPFVMKAVALALGQHPTLNASINDETEQVVYKRYVNLGVAVDTPRGLVVPAMRNVQRLSIPQIARELAVIASKARSADFAIEDLRGGTFTISNLGAVGGTYSTPIINHPEVAILLLGRSRWMPVVRDGEVVSRLMMPLSLSYDHRLVDGAAAGRFLNEVIDYLQNPGKLLLAG